MIEKFILLLAVASLCLGSNPQLVVTREYTDYLKKHVSWEVADYESNIFRGYTVEDIQMMLGNKVPLAAPDIPEYTIPEGTVIPPEFDWRDFKPKCIHEVRNQGNCGSCWSFATSGMLADRCCLDSADHGLLA